MRSITAISRDLSDLRQRLGRVTVGYTRRADKPVTAEDLGAAGAITVLLKDAIKPNLVQTLEGQPALVHCGPLGIADHGNNSLIADLVATRLGEYVITESGFGSDMGMEKFADVVCRVGQLTLSAAVLVVSVRAVKYHGGIGVDAHTDRQSTRNAIEAGMANVRRHIGIIKSFGLPTVVAVNRRLGDTNDEIELVKRLAVEAGAITACSNSGFAQGATGALELAEAVVEACSQPAAFHHIYDEDDAIQDKIEAVAKRVHGANSVFFYPGAERRISQFASEGLSTPTACGGRNGYRRGRSNRRLALTASRG